MSNSQLPTPAENSNGQILGASVALIILPTVSVALRAVSRSMSGAGFWWDDLTVVLGMMFSWALNIINILGMMSASNRSPALTIIVASRNSLGHHTEGNRPVLMSFYRDFYTFLILYSLGMTVVKFSVVLFLYRIFTVASFRRIVVACGGFVLVFGTVSAFLFIFECKPVSAFWTILADSAGGYTAQLGSHCGNIIRRLIINGSINTVTDFTLLLLPLPLLWHLRASTVQKCVLTGIFIMGLVVTAVSMVRLIIIARYHGSDVTYDFVPTSIWTAAEPSIAVVSACLPSLRPLFVRIIRVSASKSPRAQDDYFSSSNNLGWTWRSRGNSRDRTFNRLPDSGKGVTRSLSNQVAISGGREAIGTEEEILELDNRDEGVETPRNRIRAKTTVVLTISERLDWKDDLF